MNHASQGLPLQLRGSGDLLIEPDAPLVWDPPYAEGVNDCPRRIRTLVVDDSRAVVRSLTLYLGALGPEVEVVGTAANGLQALEQAEVLGPDLVLLDLQMPGMDGLETTQHLRRRFPDIRIIIITVHDTSEARLASLATGAHGFLSKARLHQDLTGEIRRVFDLA